MSFAYSELTNLTDIALLHVVNYVHKNNNTNVNINGAVIIVRVYPFHLMNVAQCHVAANFWTKPISSSHRSYIHRHHLLLLSLTADTHFTILQRVEG